MKVSKIITPLSSTSVGPTTTVSFPSLQNAFDTTGIYGNIHTDRTGVLSINHFSGITLGNNGFHSYNSHPNVSGIMPSAGAKSIVMIASGTFSSATGSVFRYGGAPTSSDADTNAYIYMTASNGSQVPWVNRTADNLNYSATLNFTTLTFPFTGCITQVVDNSGNDVNKYAASYDGTVYETKGKDIANSSGTLTGQWSSFNNSIEYFHDPLGDEGKLFAILFMTTAPTATENKIATLWMAANPGRIYPGWIGRT